MPTVNIYYRTSAQHKAVEAQAKELRSFLAETLTCGEIHLQPDEISLRLLETPSNHMRGDIELDITAHAFKERVEKQDEICIKTKDFLESLMPEYRIEVWLALPQLGHSVKN